MGNCTNTHWRRDIQDGGAAVLKLVDPQTKETVFNVGLRHGPNGTWRVAEVNTRFNHGAGVEASAACEVLVPSSATPREEVLASHSELLTQMQAGVTASQPLQAAR
jgi:hypothetical protein